MTTPFRHLAEELRVFNRNLNKDNASRRTSFRITNKKLKEINKIELEFKEIRDKFNSQANEEKLKTEVKEYIACIESYIPVIVATLNARLEQIGDNRTETGSSELDSDSDSNMPNDTFCLKTATSLLPLMNGSEETTKQLIDAIDLYSSMLNAEGKKLLINYVLKTRLTQSAKIRLESTYETVTLLVDDLKKHFTSVKSAAALSSQLFNAKQGGKSIEQFGGNIETLMTELTISQANGNDQNINVLKSVNEKAAVNIFANGLRDSDLRTIVKARNYQKLTDAISGAKDEERVGPSSSSSPQMFHMRGNGRFSNYKQNRGNSGQNFSQNNRSFYNNNQNNNNGRFGNGYNRDRFKDTYNDRGNNANHSRYRGNNFRSNNYRQNFSRSRGNNSRNNFESGQNARLYTATDQEAQRLNNEDETLLENTFFRDQK